ncbi:hypothetical protein ACLOJK_035478 [Asimina triloba]
MHPNASLPKRRLGISVTSIPAIERGKKEPLSVTVFHNIEDDSLGFSRWMNTGTVRYLGSAEAEEENGGIGGDD